MPKTPHSDNTIYNKLEKTVYQALYPKTINNRYGELLEVTDFFGDNDGFGLIFDTKQLVNYFSEQLNQDPLTAKDTLVELLKYTVYLQTQTAVKINGVENLAILAQDFIQKHTGEKLNNWLKTIEGDKIAVGFENNDTLIGTLLFANNGDDKLTGTQNNDILHGGAGDDIIKADSGNDILIGGADNDTLWGGAGADTFVFDNVYDNSIDQIMDFNFNESDKLNIIGLFNHSDKNELKDHVFFEQQNNAIIMSVDKDGTKTDFDKMPIAIIYTTT